MATIKSYTDLEQSKKLAEILPIESADMQYISFSHQDDTIEWIPRLGAPSKYDIPCWSLTALLSVLPDELRDNHYLTLEKEGKEYCCCYEDCNGNSSKHCFSDNPVDTCYEMILKLHELKTL